MGQVTLSLPSDGTTIDASDVNTPFNTLVNEFNGNIDDNNIKSGANISGAKLNDASIPGKKFDSTTYGGWIAGVLPAVSSVAANGNRSYNVTFASSVASYLTPGQRIRTTRTVAAPTQCTSLNGTTQYWVKTSPNKLTFTDDFVVSAYVKVSAYAAECIVSRYSGGNGFYFGLNSSGQLLLKAFTGSNAANFSQVLSYQSVPLNKWVHVTAQLDMSAFTATTTTSYTMIDGVDVPAAVSRGGTNPTSLTQGGNLEVGSYGGGLEPFSGKIAQVAIYNAKVTQANILATISQGLTGSETSLASAYSFNNSTTDLNTSTPNDLSAGAGSPTATNADSPFGGQADGTISSTLDYGIVTKVSTTVATVQVPEACTIPTTGGVTSVDMSPWKAPYGMPVSRGKHSIQLLVLTTVSTSGTTTNTVYNPGGLNLNVPIGDWHFKVDLLVGNAGSAAATPDYCYGLSTSSSSIADPTLVSRIRLGGVGSSADSVLHSYRTFNASLSTATPYYLVCTSVGAFTGMYIYGNTTTNTISATLILAEPAHL